jgi:predicted transcriptional regulator YheO
LTEVIKEVDGLIGNILNPTQEIILREMKKPVKRAFEKHNLKLSVRQVENIVQVFLDDMFRIN